MPQQGNERAGITLTGDELVLLEQVKRIWGMDADGTKRMSNSKLLGMCMEQTLQQRLNIMRAWVQLMEGVRGTMENLGVETEWCGAILWFNAVGQSIFSNQIDAKVFLQLTVKIDAWISEQVRLDPSHPEFNPEPMEKQAEEEIRQFFREVRGK